MLRLKQYSNRKVYTNKDVCQKQITIVHPYKSAGFTFVFTV